PFAGFARETAGVAAGESPGLADGDGTGASLAPTQPPLDAGFARAVEPAPADGPIAPLAEFLDGPDVVDVMPQQEVLEPAAEASSGEAVAPLVDVAKGGAPNSAKMGAPNTADSSPRDAAIPSEFAAWGEGQAGQDDPLPTASRPGEA